MTAPGAWLVGSDSGLEGTADDPGVPATRLVRAEGTSPPAIAEAGPVTAVFDGVLYNREDLISLLGADPRSSDAALALQAWRRWDGDALSHLNGIFALVLEDRDRRTLLAARDPLGIYPLFYARARRRWLFSTSVDLLVHHPDVSGAFNRPVLAGLVCHLWPDADETCFEQIRRVPAGHGLVVAATGHRLFRYWDPAPPDRPMPWVGPDEVEQFEGLFRQAVDRCLAFGPTGVFLSGGLDSVSVAVTAGDESARRGVPRPMGLSMTFAGEPNEEHIQREVAARLGLRQVLLPFEEAAGPEGIVMAWMELSSRWPWPVLNPWRPAYRQLALAGKDRGVDVVLTGEGGDEWLALSPKYAADLLRRLDFGGLWRMGQLTRRSYEASAYNAARLLLRHGVRTLAMSALRTTLQHTAPWVVRARRRSQHRQRNPGWVAPDPTLRREMDQRADREVDAGRGPKPPSYYLRNIRAIFTAVGRSMELEETFELGRSAGIRLLQPFWDPDLVTFLYRTPPEYLIWNGRTKGPLRRLLAERLPGLGFEAQRKVTIGTMWRDMMAAEVPHVWHKMGGLKALPALGLVDVAALERSMGARSWEAFSVTSTLNVEAWLRPRL
jgi:asparagine synthase (glutamine-hydrolysing)